MSLYIVLRRYVKQARCADIVQVARVAGMERSLRLDIGDRYSIISLLFFVPYIIFVSFSSCMLLYTPSPARAIGRY